MKINYVQPSPGKETAPGCSLWEIYGFLKTFLHLPCSSQWQEDGGGPVTQSCHCSCSPSDRKTPCQCHCGTRDQHLRTQHQQIILHSGVVNTDGTFLKLTGPGVSQCLYHITLTHHNQQLGKTGKPLNDPSSV